MNYRIESAFKENRTTIIIAITLWLLISIFFIMPYTWGSYAVSLQGKGWDSGVFMDMFTKSATSPLRGFAELFSHHVAGKYLKNLFGFTLFYLIVVVVRSNYKCTKT